MEQSSGGGRGQFAICALALKCRPRSTVSDLISHRITAKRSPWRTVWSLIPSKELPGLFCSSCLSYWLPFFFACGLRCGFITATNEEPLKDLSSLKELEGIFPSW